MDAYEAAVKLISLKRRYDANGWIRAKMLTVPQRARDEYLNVVGVLAMNTLRFFGRPDRYDENQESAKEIFDCIIEVSMKLAADNGWLHTTFPKLINQDFFDAVSIANLMRQSVVWFNAFSIGDESWRKDAEIEFLSCWYECHVMECRKIQVKPNPPPKRVYEYEYEQHEELETSIIDGMGQTSFDELKQAVSLVADWCNMEVVQMLHPEYVTELEKHIDVFNTIFPNRAILSGFPSN